MKVSRKKGFNKNPAFLYQTFVELSSYEEHALSMIKPFDVRLIDPVLVRVNTKQQRDLWNYWRITISSAGQGATARGIYRGHDWFMFDKTSGSLLGIVCYDDLDHQWQGLVDYVGGPFGEDRRAMTLKSQITRARKSGGDVASAEAALAEYLATTVPPADTQQCLQILKRCLPIPEFGIATGGKLLTLAATCTELIEYAELQYSRPLALILIKTLKGRSSQYNRLHTRGLTMVKDDSIEAGAFYVQNLRRDSLAFLRGDVSDPGPRMTFKLAEQVAYWKERWLPNRIADYTDNGWIRPNPDHYRLSNQLSEKLATRAEDSQHDHA